MCRQAVRSSDPRTSQAEGECDDHPDGFKPHVAYLLSTQLLGTVGTQGLDPLSQFHDALNGGQVGVEGALQASSLFALEMLPTARRAASVVGEVYWPESQSRRTRPPLFN